MRNTRKRNVSRKRINKTKKNISKRRIKTKRNITRKKVINTRKRNISRRRIKKKIIGGANTFVFGLFFVDPNQRLNILKEQIAGATQHALVQALQHGKKESSEAAAESKEALKSNSEEAEAEAKAEAAAEAEAEAEAKAKAKAEEIKEKYANALTQIEAGLLNIPAGIQHFKNLGFPPQTQFTRLFMLEKIDIKNEKLFVIEFKLDTAESIPTYVKEVSFKILGFHIEGDSVYIKISINDRPVYIILYMQFFNAGTGQVTQFIRIFMERIDKLQVNKPSMILESLVNVSLENIHVHGYKDIDGNWRDISDVIISEESIHLTPIFDEIIIQLANLIGAEISPQILTKANKEAKKEAKQLAKAAKKGAKLQAKAEKKEAKLQDTAAKKNLESLSDTPPSTPPSTPV